MHEIGDSPNRKFPDTFTYPLLHYTLVIGGTILK